MERKDKEHCHINCITEWEKKIKKIYRMQQYLKKSTRLPDRLAIFGMHREKTKTKKERKKKRKKRKEERENIYKEKERKKEKI